MTEQEKQARREKLLSIFGLGANPTQRGVTHKMYKMWQITLCTNARKETV